MNVGAFVVLTRNNRSEVFLVKRSDFPVWEPQGGKIEKGETPEQCAIREAYEETGFRIQIIRKVAEYTNPKTKLINSQVYEGKLISGSYVKEYPECEGKWFNVNNLPFKMLSFRKTMILDCIKNKNEIIRGDNTQIFTIKNIYLFLLMPFKCVRFLHSRLNRNPLVI